MESMILAIQCRADSAQNPTSNPNPSTIRSNTIAAMIPIAFRICRPTLSFGLFSSSGMDSLRWRGNVRWSFGGGSERRPARGRRHRSLDEKGGAEREHDKRDHLITRKAAK